MNRVFIAILIAVVGALTLVIFFSFVIRWTPTYRHAWLVRIETPGGPIPVRVVLLRRDDGWLVNTIQSESGRPDSNEAIAAQVDEYDRDRGVLKIGFPSYDSALYLEGDIGGRMTGRWEKVRGGQGMASLSVSADWIDNKESDVGMVGLNPAAFAGRWAVDFSSTDDTAVGVFEIDRDQTATGTFLTPTGDYGQLAGRVDGDLLRLSKFDGAHAFLFHARMRVDGTIEGDFWSGDWHHDTWTAVRDDNAALPDAFTQTVATGVGVEDLAFRDLAGRPTRVAELLDAGDAPARILYLFGSWCPNCADAGAEMKRLKEKYGEQLTIVGLAFEQTEDFERSARQVRLYAERHGADWPVLIAGLADKAKASAELPVLDRVRAYPTTVFLDAENAIVAVHTGFSGPATGDEHRRLQRRFEGIVEGLIGP